MTPTPALSPSWAPTRAASTARMAAVALVAAVVVMVTLVVAGIAGLAPSVSAAPGSGAVTRSAEAVAADDPATDADDAIVQNPLGAGTAADDDFGASDAENRRIWAVIGGLVLVAMALTALTVRYWQVTRPVPVEDRHLDPDPEEPGDADGVKGSRRSKERSARERQSGRATGRRARGANDQSAADAFDTDDLFVDDPRLPEARGD